MVKSKKKSSVINFVNSLELFGIGYSWGGFESLAILQELKGNHKDEYIQGRKFYRFKKDEHIVRLHIGLEDPKDLILDLKKFKKNKMMKNFFPNKVALFTLLGSCFVVCVTMGVRQTFGLYSVDFNNTSGVSNTEFGLAIAVHAIFWGIFTPIFGRISDKYGGYVVIIPALIFYSIAMFLMSGNLITGIWLQINLGLLVGLGLAGAAGTILTPMVSKHFPNENRSKAAGYVTACGGLGMFLFPIMANIFKNISDWQTSFLIFSVILFIMLIPAFFVKLPENKTDTVSSNIDSRPLGEVLKESFAHKGFRLLILGFLYVVSKLL